MIESEVRSFEAWRYRVDTAATREAYGALDRGEAESCGCGYCLNWIKYRGSVIPLHVQDWLVELGIDIAKEIEVSEYEGGPATNLYIGEYLFIGEVLSGPDPYVPFGDGTGATLEPLEIFPGFALGLSSSSTLGAPVPVPFKGHRLV